jgi:cyclophilin family peptidyl-prolyl cis-trans isomerase
MRKITERMLEKQGRETKLQVVTIKTNAGDIRLMLWVERAPRAAANFLFYVNEGFYDNTVFDRTAKDLFIAAGGYALDGLRKKLNVPLMRECESASVPHFHKRGVIAAVRDAWYAKGGFTAQFIINLAKKDKQDFYHPAYSSVVFSPFGMVIDGIEVADKLSAVSVNNTWISREKTIIYSISKDKLYGK